MSFGETLQRIRKQKGMTQAGLSEKSSVSREAIGNYENDRRTPTIETVRKLATALEVDYFELVEFRSVDDEGILLNDDPDDDSTALKARLINHFDKLNEVGQKKAVDEVSDLATHPRYTK